MQSRKTSVDSQYYAKNGDNNTNNNNNANNNRIENDSKIKNKPGEEDDASDSDYEPNSNTLTRLEHRLNISDLQKLNEGFEAESAKYEKNLELSKSQFSKFMSTIIDKGSRKEYDELFENIDVTKSGFVDWEKFTSYMLLMLYESDDRTRTYSVPNWKTIKNINNHHRDSVKRITFVKPLNSYISISKEGCCCVFGGGVTLNHHIRIHNESCKTRDLWVTDFIIMLNVNKIALSFTTKEIEIYDCSKLDFNCQLRITNMPATALCMDYWFDPVNDNDAILLWGDTKGDCHTIHFNSAKIALFERPSQATSNEKQDACLQVDVTEIKTKYKNATYVSYNAHNGWIKKIKWINHLECIVSCCASDTKSMAIGWFEKTNSHVRNTYVVPIRDFDKTSSFDLTQGINSFDYDEKLNLIATANINSHINLYNPYVQEANGILKGHMRTVLSVQFMQSRGQLISFSRDKIIRLWNVHLQMCIQRIANSYPVKAPDVDVTCWYDEMYSRVFVTFRNAILLMEMKSEVKDRVLTHTKPVVAAKFNKLNNQVVSLAQDGTLAMWLIDNGQKIKIIPELHGHFEVTCMDFDDSNTKFYTASTDGTIKIWDFNGHCYHTLDTDHNGEISQVVTLKRRIIAVGSVKQMITYRNSMFRDHKVKPSEWRGKQEHDDDILSAALMKDSPNYLATGGFDGNIVIWNSATELAFKHLNQRKRVNGPKEAASSGSKGDKTSGNRRSSLTKPKFDLDNNAEQDDEAMYAVTCLRFLNTRAINKDAVLVSCGGNGWVRFWNLANGDLAAEFESHAQASSVVMEVDESEKYLATGDLNGQVKIWNISEYCVNTNLYESNTLIKEPPPLITTIDFHTDVIKTIDFCNINNNLFIIIASFDCRVSLHNIYGMKIGVFGQEEHWKLDGMLTLEVLESEPNTPMPENVGVGAAFTGIEKASKDVVQEKLQESMHEEKKEIKKEAAFLTHKRKESNQFRIVKNSNERLNFEETFVYADDEFIRNPTLRYNPWSKTILGKTYQEARVSRRERRQPGLIVSEEFKMWEKTGQAPGGLYGALQTPQVQQFTDADAPRKPDFMINPHRYFRDKSLMKNTHLDQHIPTIAETLHSAFDEKTLFPKYILDFEARMRQDHKRILEQAAHQQQQQQEPITPHHTTKKKQQIT